MQFCERCTIKHIGSIITMCKGRDRQAGTNVQNDSCQEPTIILLLPADVLLFYIENIQFCIKCVRKAISNSIERRRKVSFSSFCGQGEKRLLKMGKERENYIHNSIGEIAIKKFLYKLQEVIQQNNFELELEIDQN